MKNVWMERKGDVDFWEHGFCSDVTTMFSEQTLADMEKRVYEWLRDESDQDPIIQFHYNCGWCDSVMFTRSEIQIKSCDNVWNIWRIAESNSYPKIISYRVKQVGTNESYKLSDKFRMPNEIRSENYGPT